MPDKYSKGPTLRPRDIISAIGSGIANVLDANYGPPQAYTRVTRTPVRWDSMDDGSYAKYYPTSRSIKVNVDAVPQFNPDEKLASGVLRHEEVHALLPPETVKSITGYFDANPKLAEQARGGLAWSDPDAASSNAGLAMEAPAYAVQGVRFGGEEPLQQYITRMPEDVKQKYKKLLWPQGE
jgi:hypothetical protein